MLNIAKSIDSPDLLLYEFMTKKNSNRILQVESKHWISIDNM